MSIVGFSRNLFRVENRSINRTTFFNFTNSTYEPATNQVPGLIYTLFGLTCFFTCLGLAGNISILIMSMKSLRRQKSYDVLITALAVTDSIALATIALQQPCVYETIGTDVRAVTNIGCKIFMSVLISAMFCSSTVVVLISIERFLAVRCVSRYQNFGTRLTALRSVCLCATVIVIISVTLSILYIEIDENGVCYANYDGRVYSSVLKRKPDTTVYKAMGILMSSPLVLLLFLTPMTVIKLCKQMTHRRQLTPISRRRDIRNLQISVKLIMVVLVHLTLIAVPLAITLTLASIGKAIEGNVESGITLALLLNHSTNFLVYNIFDGEFRRRVKILFGFGEIVRNDNECIHRPRNINTPQLVNDDV